MSGLYFTLYEATWPKVLTKRIGRRANGKLFKKAAAQMTAGRATLQCVPDLYAFADRLAGLTSAQAIGPGIAPGHPAVCLVTDARVSEGCGAISRTRRFFQFSQDPGVMMLDFDGHPDGPLDPDRLHALLVEAVPELADALMLWRPSASSCIEDSDGSELVGIAGQRLYFAVADASAIPAAGSAIITRLWAAGIGWFAISRSGLLLSRTLFDASVWWPERLDFAGPADLLDGLRRRVVEPRYFGPAGAAPFDLRRIEADGDHEARAAHWQQRAREAAAPKARPVRKLWLEAQARKLAEQRSNDSEQSHATQSRPSAPADQPRELARRDSPSAAPIVTVKGAVTAETVAKGLGGHRVGSGWSARCPTHDDRTPSLSLHDSSDGKVLVHCHAGCDQHKVIAHLKAKGLWPRNFPNMLRGAASRPTEPDLDDSQRTEDALSIYQAAKPSNGTLVESYLRSRGLLLPMISTLRFHPALKHHPSGASLPAMIALVTRGADDAPLAIHRTYLSADGTGKAPVEPQKMMLGPCRGGTVRLAEPGNLLMVGEGIETCLAAMQATGHPAWAALSTYGLRALTLPKNVRDVIVLADGDDPGEAAARHCALRWKREGRRVRIARPPRGKDFNDMLMGCVPFIRGVRNER